jgi:hypothetical protein
MYKNIQSWLKLRLDYQIVILTRGSEYNFSVLKNPILTFNPIRLPKSDLKTFEKLGPDDIQITWGWYLEQKKWSVIKHMVSMVSRCLLPFHLLRSGHYYEPSSPQQTQMTSSTGRDQVNTLLLQRKNADLNYLLLCDIHLALWLWLGLDFLINRRCGRCFRIIHCFRALGWHTVILMYMDEINLGIMSMCL